MLLVLIAVLILNLVLDVTVVVIFLFHRAVITDLDLCTPAIPGLASEIHNSAFDLGIPQALECMSADVVELIAAFVLVAQLLALYCSRCFRFPLKVISFVRILARVLLRMVRLDINNSLL